MDSPSSKDTLPFPPWMYRNMDIDHEQVNSPDMDADFSPNKVETSNLHTDAEEITLVSIMKAIQHLSSQVDTIARTQSLMEATLLKLTTIMETAPSSKALDKEMSRGQPKTPMITKTEENSSKTAQKTKQYSEDHFKNISRVILDNSDEENVLNEERSGLRDTYVRQSSEKITSSSLDKGKSKLVEMDAGTAGNASGTTTFDKRNSIRKLPFTKAPTLKKVKTEAKSKYQAKNKMKSPATVTSKQKSTKTVDVGICYESHSLTPYKNAKCGFIPSPNMNLNLQEVQLSAYIFDTELDSGELVWICGNNSGSRYDFECLCPERIVRRKIIHMMAVKITWTQSKKSEKTVWCLPPDFAHDVLDNNAMDVLLVQYAKEWMHPFKQLSLIYIPVHDIDHGHWYLMIISIKEKKIYHFDSYLTPKAAEERMNTMRKLSNTLDVMMPLVYLQSPYYKGNLNFGSWPIVEAQNIPKSTNSHTSGLCVVEWMSMEHAFFVNVPQMLDENVVRMKVALRLLMGPQNECLEKLSSNALSYWSELIKKGPKNAKQATN